MALLSAFFNLLSILATPPQKCVFWRMKEAILSKIVKTLASHFLPRNQANAKY